MTKKRATRRRFLTASQSSQRFDNRASLTSDENLRRSLREDRWLVSCASGEVWGGGVLEFLGDGEAGDLRAGAVLPDEVYVL